MMSTVALTLNAAKPRESGSGYHDKEPNATIEAIRQKDTKNWQDYKQCAHIIMNSTLLPLHIQMRKLVFSYIGFQQLIILDKLSPKLDTNSQRYQVLASFINNRNNVLRFYRIAEKDLDTFFAEISASSLDAVKSPEKPAINQKSQCCSLL